MGDIVEVTGPHNNCESSGKPNDSRYLTLERLARHGAQKLWMLPANASLAKTGASGDAAARIGAKAERRVLRTRAKG